MLSVRGVGLLTHDGAALSERVEGHVDLDLVVGQRDHEDRETVCHDVLVEREVQRHGKGTVLRRELYLVLLDVGRDRELPDLLDEAGLGAGSTLPS